MNTKIFETFHFIPHTVLLQKSFVNIGNWKKYNEAYKEIF